MAVTPSRVTLNTNEQLIVDTLLATAAFFKTNTTIRIVGGWVRDKQLGNESTDIDITVDNMTGLAFSNLIRQYVAEHTTLTISSVGVIRPNPSIGKHLETATLHINHIPIDICSLRSASSAASSAGSPLEDARQRDFTVNALFYRVNDNTVEDLTGLGLADLAQRVIRTPIPALETLRYDPLRALRAVRFSARLHATLDAELRTAILAPDIQTRLATGTSRERIGKEVALMCATDNVAYCLEQLVALGLFEAVFGAGEQTWVVGTVRALEVLYARHAVAPLLFGVLAAVFLPRRELREPTGRVSPVQRAVMETLKLGTAEKNAVLQIHQAYDYLVAKSGALVTRLDYGRFVLLGKELWKAALLLYVAQQAPAPAPTQPFGPVEVDAAAAGRVEAFVAAVDAMGLARAWETRPLVNGAEVAALRGRERGPWLKGVMDRVVEWQLERPDATKADAELFVKQLAL